MLNLKTPPASINTFPFPLKAITLPPYVLPLGAKFVLGAPVELLRKHCESICASQCRRMLPEQLRGQPRWLWLRIVRPAAVDPTEHDWHNDDQDHGYHHAHLRVATTSGRTSSHPKHRSKGGMCTDQTSACAEPEVPDTEVRSSSGHCTSLCLIQDEIDCVHVACRRLGDGSIPLSLVRPPLISACALCSCDPALYRREEAEANSSNNRIRFDFANTMEMEHQRRNNNTRTRGRSDSGELKFAAQTASTVRASGQGWSQS